MTSDRAAPKDAITNEPDLQVGECVPFPMDVLSDTSLSHAAKVVYGHLLWAALNETDVDDLSAVMGVERKRALAYLSELRDARLVTSLRRGQGKPNLYVLRDAPGTAVSVRQSGSISSADPVYAFLKRDWDSLRATLSPLVFERDNHCCRHCGYQSLTELTVDHIVPLVLYGSNDLSNLQSLCRSCNSKKGTGAQD